MKIGIDLLLIIACMFVLVQDLRDRMISVLLLLVIGISLGAKFYFFGSSEENNLLLLSNCLFSIGQVCFVYLYFVYFRRKKARFFDEVLGWGDVIMILCMSMVFPLPQLIIYLLVSYFIGMFFLIFSRNKTIPLAGIMALVYAINTISPYLTGFSLISTFTA